MSLHTAYGYPRGGSGDLADRLRGAHAVTTELLSDVISGACGCFPPIRRTENSARIERLIKSGAWTDAVLALIELELPQWRIRRIVYDNGEWHCALSRQRELPDWLDQSVEASHADLFACDAKGIRRRAARRPAIDQNKCSNSSLCGGHALCTGLLR